MGDIFEAKRLSVKL
jgi:hypothetical protein